MVDLDTFVKRLRQHPEKAPEFASHITEINEQNLRQELEEQAALFAWWTTKYALARQRAAELEDKYEKRKAAAVNNSTEDRITAAKEEAKSQPQVVEAREAYQSAERDRRMFKAIVDALKQRKDMLIQLSAHKRTEAESI